MPYERMLTGQCADTSVIAIFTKLQNDRYVHLWPALRESLSDEAAL